MRLVTLKDAARISCRTVADLEALIASGALTWRVCSQRPTGTVRFYSLAEVLAAVMRADLRKLETA